MGRSLWLGALTLATLGTHWFVLGLAALGASAEFHACSYPCPPIQHNYGWRTLFVLLPEVVVVAGLLALLARRTRTWRHIYILTGVTAAALLVVATTVLTNPSLIRAAPPDPFFDAWR